MSNIIVFAPTKSSQTSLKIFNNLKKYLKYLKYHLLVSTADRSMSSWGDKTFKNGVCKT